MSTQPRPYDEILADFILGVLNALENPRLSVDGLRTLLRGMAVGANEEHAARAKLELRAKRRGDHANR